MASKKSFMSPYDPSLDIPGTEGWREMYPFHSLFIKDDMGREKYEKETFWYFDALHCPEPIPPFDLIWEDARHLSMGMLGRCMIEPFNYGMDYRVINGYCYIGVKPVEDREVIQKRMALFQERAGYYFDHWQELYDENWHKKMHSLIDELKGIRFPDLPDVEDFAVIRKGRGHTSAHPVLDAYHRMIGLAYKQWDYHFEFLLYGYGAILQFMDTMKNLFPDISDQSISKTTMGFDAAIFRPTLELQNLAVAAVELGTADVFLTGRKWEEVEPVLQRTGEGREWLDRFEAARDPWFEMSGGGGYYHTDGCWNDNPELPLTHIRNYIEALHRGETIIKPQEEIIEERDRVTAEYRGLIKTEEDRDAFDRALGLARLVSPWAEDHNFYCENWFHSLFYRKMRKLGEFLVTYGPLEEGEDVFYLNTFEINQVLFDAVAKWYSYLTPVAKTFWPEKIRKRREILERFREWNPPPAVGAMPHLPLNPVFVTLHGLTEDQINEWLSAEKVSPQDVTTLKGIGGSPGIAEGTAKVCRNAFDISTLGAGDILVAPSTSPTWAPAFKIINGAAIDQGGIFAHTAIVCREYKLPAVMGTTTGTRIIRTGDRIRVDGDEGIVTILERAG